MSNDKYPVAMFKQINGERKQIGWASPVDPETNSRTFEKSPGFENESLDGVSFEDNEQSQQFAEEHEGEEVDIQVDHNTVIEPEEDPSWDENGDDEAGISVLQIEEETPETEVEETPLNDSYPQNGDEGKDSAPLQVEQNETVELDNGGAITDVADEDEEAAFERELAEEQAREAAAADAPQSRREARENEENN